MNWCMCVVQTDLGFLSLDKAMNMFGLERSELFWEKARDTKLLMAWSNERIVLAFRGTASLSNVLSDVQVRASKGVPCL